MPQPWAELRSPFGAQAQLFHTNLTAMQWTTDIFWSYKSVNYFWGNMKDAEINYYGVSVCKKSIADFRFSLVPTQEHGNENELGKFL